MRLHLARRISFFFSIILRFYSKTLQNNISSLLRYDYRVPVDHTVLGGWPARGTIRKKSFIEAKKWEW